MAYTYANQTQNRLPAILGVAGVHAGIGALLIYGLASGEFEKIVQPPLEGGQIELPPPPPPETLLIAAAHLPEPLKRFRPRDGYATDPDRPELAFPPEGAVLAATGAIPARVRDGRPPFTWMVNGRPVETGRRSREVLLEGLGKGFTELSVIDASGRSARVQVVLE